MVSSTVECWPYALCIPALLFHCHLDGGAAILAGLCWSGVYEVAYWCVFGECSSVWSKMFHGRRVTYTAIFFFRTHCHSFCSSGIFWPYTVNSCGQQYQCLQSERFKNLWYSRLAPQAIGGEDELRANWIQNFQLGEPWFQMFHDLSEISMVK